MNQKAKIFLKYFFVLMLGVFSVQALATWFPPKFYPISGNIDTPINISSNGQEKNGVLAVKGFKAFGPAIFEGSFQVTLGSGIAGKVLTSDPFGVGSWQTMVVPPPTLSALLPAVAPNTIDNSDATNKSFTQEWQWNKLGIAQTGLRLSSTATTTDNNAKLLESAFKGSQNLPSKTYAGYFTNTNTGSSNINYAGYFSASNSNIPTNNKNYAIVVPSGGGNVGIGTVTPSALLHLGAGTASIAPLKFTTSAGVLTSPLQDGAMEYGNSHLYFTLGSTRAQLDQQGSGGSLTWNKNVGAGFVYPKILPDQWDPVGNLIGIGTSTPGQQLEITKSLKLADTVDATTGVIYKGEDGFNQDERFIHNMGLNNSFIGKNSGNFTLTGPNNVGIGFQALTNEDSGNDNVAIGYKAFESNSSGTRNVVVGYKADYSTSSSNSNVVVGPYYGTYTEGYDPNPIPLPSKPNRGLTPSAGGDYNVLLGHMTAWMDTTSLYRTTAVGYFALTGVTTGDDNVAIGSGALNWVSSGNSNVAFGGGGINTTGNYNVSIGNGSGPNVNSINNTIAIGNDNQVHTSDTVKIGGGSTNNILSGNIETSGGFRQNGGLKVPCTSANRGMTWFTNSSPNGTYQICAKDALNVFGWQTIPFI